ncbi:hypothetical protein HX021_15590 [Sphingobacterium sp. N143]|uniref:hypothetical protein n=1 Tax=Sphingobacterium sp. N143 TaxID=2746727 RepID=UPI002577B48E|nr:hypothetical protein [Sphingobacterium sp. N143]MDM1295714.1 hypothetical protein [Sphingobacterium sp. N143]
MRILFKIFSLLFCLSFLYGCAERPVIDLIDKNGNVHHLRREGEKKRKLSIEKIIELSNDTIMTIDGTGHKMIWTSTKAAGLDTTTLKYYLKKGHENGITFYLPSNVSQDFTDDRG